MNFGFVEVAFGAKTRVEEDGRIFVRVGRFGVREQFCGDSERHNE